MDMADMPPAWIANYEQRLTYQEPLTCWCEERVISANRSDVVSKVFWVSTDMAAYVLTCDEADR